MNGNLSRCCDLVMKGGVTSGVLYPSAIQEIAGKFHFVGIGGTSAGAIAACVTAAAEYRRRQTGSKEGFEMLDRVARELSDPGRLLSLFRPDRETRRLFRALIKIVEGKKGVLGIAGLLLWRRKKKLRTIVDNGYGLCTGMANGNVDPDNPSLTPWLADLIDEIAGKDDAPLTFRDLHEAKIPDGVRQLMGDRERAIDLRAVTTSLTYGRPVEIPFNSYAFAFDPVEWSRLFPARIVDFVRRKAEQIDSAALKKDGKLPLPIADLPVIVAARMSLSFPVLFTMVPLWSVNYHLEESPLERNWFSDGGITSNFPIQFFDALYPRWPTLGINLQRTDDQGRPQRRRLRNSGEKVYLASNRSSGVQDLSSYFDTPGEPLKSLLGFGGAIFNSAQNWHDNSFLKLPGYRDRVAEIWLTAEEGGLNLNMDPQTIEDLVERGRAAGEQLAHRFADLDPSDTMSWEGHRWTRFRSSMPGLMRSLIALRRSARTVSPGSSNLLDLLATVDAPPAYEFDSDPQRRAAEQVTGLLLDFIARAEEAAQHGCSGVSDREEGPFCKGPRPPAGIGGRAPI